MAYRSEKSRNFSIAIIQRSFELFVTHLIAITVVLCLVLAVQNHGRFVTNVGPLGASVSIRSGRMLA
jgi:hypothetical protein